MMALDPQLRPQTPQQLLDQIRQVRHQLKINSNDNSSAAALATPTVTVFVVERHEHLQEIIREKLKKLGYRVLLSAMPERAWERFAQQPFQGVIVDVGSVGEEGVQALLRLLKLAEDKGVSLTAIALLSEGQNHLAAELAEQPRVTVLRRPLNLGDLVRSLTHALPPK
jgi:serine/threonine-protein kinase